MLRHPRRSARTTAIAVLAAALAAAGCGIKGPLEPAPKPESTAPTDAAKPADRGGRTEPKL